MNEKDYKKPSGFLMDIKNNLDEKEEEEMEISLEIGGVNGLSNAKSKGDAEQQNMGDEEGKNV